MIIDMHKKLTVIFLLSLFCSLNIIAQDEPVEEVPPQSNIPLDSERFFRFGGKAGVNVNKLHGKSFNNGFNYNYQIGAFLQFNFSQRFGIQPEVNWVQTNSEFTDDATVIFDDIFRGGNQKNASFNYLEIPLLLNVNVGVSKHVKLQAGPAFGFLLKEKNRNNTDSSGLYSKNELGLVGGFWLQLPLIHIGARYKYGLTNIRSVNSGELWKSQVIQVFLGITI